MANKSAKAPMAVDKSNSPVWVKMVIIVVVISFAAGGVAIVAAGISGGGSHSATPGTTVSGNTITDEYQPRVDAAMAAAESSPDNPEVIIEVGHAYFEWAVALYEAGQIPASIPVWKSAVSYYDDVLAVDPSNDIALGNKAFALYYAQDAELAPAALQAFIDGAAGNTGLAEQLKNAQGMLAEMEAASGAATTTP